MNDRQKQYPAPGFLDRLKKICEDKGITRFDGAIRDYKKILAKKMGVFKV